MKKIALYCLTLLALALTSCEDVIDVKLDQGQPQLAVDGTITDQPGPYTVTLTTTAAYFNNAPTPRVSGATVVISDNEGNSEQLQEAEPGKYVTSRLQGKIGNHYILDIKVDGEEYRAETDIRPVPPIDSLGQEYKKNSPGFDDGYYVLYYGPELPETGDYYRFRVYRNDTLLNKPEDLTVTSDELVQGKYITGVQINNEPFRVGDSVRVEVCSITQDNYYFYNELSRQINNGGIFANPPANVRTNVKNVNPNSTKKAVGYFGGMGINAKSTQIQDIQ